jgi:hypothetical protein
MPLVFEQTINLTEDTHNTPPLLVDQLSIMHEARDGELVQYYIDRTNRTEGDKNTYAIGIYTDGDGATPAHYEYIEYPDAQWNSAASRITRQAIDRLGLKAFPNIGSIAFYKIAYRNLSVILAPVNYANDRTQAPKFTYAISSDSKSITITFTEEENSSIKYMAYRVSFAYGPHTLEYITYEKTITITNFPVSGDYILYCSGYVSDGEGSSEISKEEEVSLIGLYEEWPSITPGAGDKYLIGLDFDEYNYAVATMSDGQQIISEHPASGGGGGGGGANVYMGTEPPSSNLGTDGSLYVQYAIETVGEIREWINPNRTSLAFTLDNWLYDLSDNFELVYKMIDNPRLNGDWPFILGTGGAHNAKLFTQYNLWGGRKVLNISYNGTYSGDGAVAYETPYDYTNYYKLTCVNGTFKLLRGATLDNITEEVFTLAFTSSSGATNEVVKFLAAFNTSTTLDINIYSLDVYSNTNVLKHSYRATSTGLIDTVSHHVIPASVDGYTYGDITIPGELLPVFKAMFVKINSLWIPIDSADSSAIYNIIPAVLSGNTEPSASDLYEGQQYIQYGTTTESLYIPLNSWFDTNYVPNSNTKFIFKANIPMPDAANSFATPFGSRRATLNQGFWFGVRSNGATYVIIGHGSSETSPFVATPYYDRDIQVTYSNTEFEITNGVDTNTSQYGAYDYSANTAHTYIGTLCENNHDYGAVCHCALYLYALEVYENDVLVHNFVPYLDDTVACLKDTVTDDIITITGDPATYYPSVEKIVASWYKLHGTVQPMQVSEQYSPTININEGSQGITMWRIKYYSHDGETYLGREYVENGDNGEWEPDLFAYGFATQPNGEPVENARNNITSSIDLYLVDLDSFDVLKQDMAETSYCRLSTAIGDGATYNGRYFTRTTDEPVIFISMRNDSYMSYGVLSLSATPPSQTYNGYGNLVKDSQAIIDSSTVYLHRMNGMWNSGSPVYTVDSASVTIDNSTLYSKSGTWTCNVQPEAITNFIRRYIRLLQEQ